MGKFEEEDSKKVLAGQHVMRGTRMPSIVDFLLIPFRAYKNWQHRKQIRESLYKGPAGLVPLDETNRSTYAVAPEDGREIEKDNWLHELVSDDDKKGE